MSVKITDNGPAVKIKSNRGINLALRMALEDVDREAFRTTPKKMGNLRKNLRKSVSGKKGTITWSSSYAAYQERGYTSGPVRKYTTAGTGAHFARNAVRKVGKNFGTYVKRYTL